LSGGERQLVALSRALVQGARVLFLDEALSRMDLHHQAAVGQLMVELAAEGYAFILVSHDINIASEWARTALMLRRGTRIAYGPIREVLTQERVLELYPGSKLVVGSNPATGAPKVFFGSK
jgi:iron complex transport system ATP-binding protein